MSDAFSNKTDENNQYHEELTSSSTNNSEIPVAFTVSNYDKEW